MEKCKNCRYFEEGICRVPLYADGVLYAGSRKGEDDGCWLIDPESGKNEDDGSRLIDPENEEER